MLVSSCTHGHARMNVRVCTRANRPHENRTNAANPRGKTPDEGSGRTPVTKDYIHAVSSLFDVRDCP